MKKKSKAGKYIAPTLCALLVMVIALFYLGIFLWCMLVEPIATPMLALFILGPAAVLFGIIYSLVERYHEIKGGEEDDSADY